MNTNNVEDFKNECEDNDIYDVGQLYNHIEYFLSGREKDVLTDLLKEDIDVFMEFVEEAFPGDDEMTKRDFEKLLEEYR